MRNSIPAGIDGARVDTEGRGAGPIHQIGQKDAMAYTTNFVNTSPRFVYVRRLEEGEILQNHSSSSADPVLNA